MTRRNLLDAFRCAAILLAAGQIAWALDPADEARQILRSTGVKGGLVVHVGCGDGRLTAALHATDGYLVHGLDRSEENIRKARDSISERGLYGQVSVGRWSGNALPYIDNVVNLLVVEEPARVSEAEMMRVLCPNGVASVQKDGKWTKTVKPWSDDIDEWTHFLHDATGNAVAKDSRIATPKHLQWQAEPKRTRDHDALASISAMTSSGGRMFYILDEGLTSLIHRPAKWHLVARDAFNGMLLWKRSIDSWVTHLHYFRSGPAQLPRRLVSIGDRVYATLGLGAPVTALDAATGKTLLTYKGSEKTEEFICLDGILLAVVGDPDLWNRYAPKVGNYWDFSDENGPQATKRIVAYQADTGKELWRIEGRHLARLAPLSLAAGNKRAFYLDSENLYCVDLPSGKDLWKAPFPTKGLFLMNYAPTVVQYNDTIVCLSLDRLSVFAVEDGRKLWETTGYAGFASPGDLFVIDDLVWTFPTTATVHVDKQKVPGKGNEFLAFDLYTGQVKKRLAKKDVWPGGHHHRCYRDKATERYFISGRRGLEFVDLKGNDNTINWWLRGVCQYGIMPCNGLIYTPPHPCKCFVRIKFDGFHAVAAQRVKAGPESRPAERLLKGPAYEPVSNLESEGQNEKPTAAIQNSKTSAWAAPAPNAHPEEWPTYRHDMTRSGCASTKVPTHLRKKWQADIGAKLSSVVVAENRLFVSAVDRQTLYCLDAASGRTMWRFVAEGRVDSPPTISGGTAFFGCRGGYVYALRAADGELAWRYRGAPRDRRTVVRDRLESAWPIHGSVLAQEGTVYFAAGRSSYLDGGIRLVGLDARTGAVRCATTFRTEGVSQSGGLPDVLVSDGQSICMRHMRYNSSLEPGRGRRAGVIVANTGLLEDCWGHRWNWMLGGGATCPAGKLLVFDGGMAYGVETFYTFLKHDNSMQPSTHTGHLHQKYARYRRDQFPIGTRLFAQQNKVGESGKRRRLLLAKNNHTWDRKTLVQFRAMVLAGDALFAAGWKDSATVPEENPNRAGGTVLLVVSTADGKTLREYPLDAQPVFDGLAAAYGSLYMAMKNGKVACWAGGNP